MTLTTSRRSLLAGLASAIAAPAIVRADSLMPLRGVPISEFGRTYWFQTGWGNRSGWKQYTAREAIDYINASCGPTQNDYINASCGPTQNGSSVIGLRVKISEKNVLLTGEKYQDDVVVNLVGAKLDEKYCLPNGFSKTIMVNRIGPTVIYQDTITGVPNSIIEEPYDLPPARLFRANV